MNPPIDPADPIPQSAAHSSSSSADTPPPLPPALTAEADITQILEALLKRPAQLVAELQQPRSGRLGLILGAAALLALAGYGFVMGTFSGGSQLLAAPLKVSLGTLASFLICLPSLFIFACLTGAEVSFRGLCGVLLAMGALLALLLIGFAPVAWVFSQSTESVVFMGTLHLVFWTIALLFALRLLGLLMDFLRVRERLHLRVWIIIFVLVNLQMMTALRPLIGTSDRWLPREKKFFVAHWIDNISRSDGTAPLPPTGR